MNFKSLSLTVLITTSFSVFAAPITEYSETFMKACGEPQAKQIQIYKDELLAKGDFFNSLQKSISKNKKLALLVAANINGDQEIQSLKERVAELLINYENEMNQEISNIIKEKHDIQKAQLHSRIQDHLKLLDINLASHRVNIVSVSQSDDHILTLNADGLFIRIELNKNQVAVIPEAYKTYYNSRYTYDISKDKKAILEQFSNPSELILEDIQNRPLSLQQAISSWVTSGLNNAVIFNGEVYSIYEYKLKNAIRANSDILDQIKLCSGASSSEKFARKLELISEKSVSE